MAELIKSPKTSFIEVECPKCGNKQIVFSNSATVVKCKNCGETLVVPQSGKAKILGKIVRVLS